MSYWHEGVGPWMVVDGIPMLMLWAGAIGLIVWGIAALTKRSHSGNGVLAIAREHNAREEISKEEFEGIERDLS
jgi:uncharacterized membrane protein